MTRQVMESGATGALLTDTSLQGRVLGFKFSDSRLCGLSFAKRGAKPLHQLVWGHTSNTSRVCWPLTRNRLSRARVAPT
jgi:hypothetical protein